MKILKMEMTKNGNYRKWKLPKMEIIKNENYQKRKLSKMGITKIGNYCRPEARTYSGFFQISQYGKWVLL